MECVLAGRRRLGQEFKQRILAGGDVAGEARDGSPSGQLFPDELAHGRAVCAARDLRQGGFTVFMAEDACAAMSQVGHDNAIGYLDKNFCHVKPTDEIVAELEASAARTELLVT